jgi:hypothetical protein
VGIVIPINLEKQNSSGWWYIKQRNSDNDYNNKIIGLKYFCGGAQFII